MNNDYNGNFKSKEEFESVIGRGCELGFEWKNHEYCIFKQNDNTWFFGFTGTDTSKDISLKTLDDVMKLTARGSLTFAQNSLLSKEHFKYLNKTFEEIFKGTKKVISFTR